MEYSQIDLYEFLTESELQHYYNAVKNELKITNAAQFKYATDEDLKSIGLSRPELRRLRKFYDKHFPHGYLSKIKRLLQTPPVIGKRDESNGAGGVGSLSQSSVTNSSESLSLSKATNSPGKAPNNKHIIPADSITVNKQLGTGEFGIVQQGVWTNCTERIQVAIKCLCRERMQSNPMEFLKEAAIMHSIEHENIVRLYGVVLATDSLMLVTELAHLRSLLECLKDPGLRVSFLTIPTLCEFAMQICNGMRYLEQKRLIHRDLAARNILVFSKNKVKISDFGLSRALGVGKDYYKTNFNVNLKLPIAWCAPECINYLRFTNGSDVWAYGVCLWEMFSYGFQPWAALTGLEILEAIDGPNYQRLEQPECCPREYYTLMMKCWQDDPSKRPKFSEIYEMLPDMKPEQLKAITNCLDANQLMYRQGEIITVLDRNTGTPFWKGVLNSGKTGFFNPSNTVAHLEGLPSANRDFFCRANERSSKRKLRTEMISKPQNDLKHTGHVGIDGASFGDVAFLSNTQNYNHVPHQIVTPYKPSEDIEQTPLLLPPTPTSPDSQQTASGYFSEATNSNLMNPSFVSSTENTPKRLDGDDQSKFKFPGQAFPGINFSTNPFTHKLDDDLNAAASFAMQNSAYFVDGQREQPWKLPSAADDHHEYHEISDDEMTADKLDFGPSLMDEINSMFGSISTSIGQRKSPEFDGIQAPESASTQHKVRKCNSSAGETSASKLASSSSSSKKKAGSGSVKQISVKDEKILNHAIEIANEISARSMIDLVSDNPSNAHSPKRKFSFRFPHLSSNGVHEKSHPSPTSGHAGGGGTHSSLHGKGSSPYSKKKNFTEELQNIPDLQSIIGEEGREAYNSLIERKAGFPSPVSDLLKQFDTNEFEIATAKTLPRSMQLCNNEEPNEKQCHVPQPTANGPANALRPMTLPTRGAYNRAAKKGELALNNNYNNNSIFKSDCPAYTNGNIESDRHDGDTAANPIPLPPRDGKKHIAVNAKRHVRKYPLIIPANGVQRTLNKVTEKGSLDDDVECGNAGGMRSDCQKSLLQRMTCEVVPAVRHQQGVGNIVNNNNNHSGLPQQKQPQMGTSLSRLGGHPAQGRPAAADQPQHIYQNLQRRQDDSTTDSASLQFESILEADINQGHVLQSPDVTDGFYNFAIQKEDFNKSKQLDYDAQKMSGLYVNEDELRNLDIEAKLSSETLNAAAEAKEVIVPPPVEPVIVAAAMVAPPITSAATLAEGKIPITMQALVTPPKTTPLPSSSSNELNDNPLFRKALQQSSPADATTAANGQASCSAAGSRAGQTEGEYFAATAMRLASSNSVSCEDLLEFSDKKPKGCERGVDSDEVRIMMKVLGTMSTPGRCLATLEFIKWDVHKAIKIIKLQNIGGLGGELSLGDCVAALQEWEWDLHLTALKLKSTNNNKT